MTKKITIAYGDGIGPEIMEATIKVLKAAKCDISFETIEIGEKLYNQGWSSGITDNAMSTVKESGVLFKAPITTPQGKGYKSLNVTFRKALGLYANVRPIISYDPAIISQHPNIDLVIVRENEEDLYTGIEYMLTSNTSIAFKTISHLACERIIRYAFEYAKLYGRKKVTCISKDNIMKITDGMFHAIFNAVANEYPNIAHDHYIVDIGSAKVASDPKIFDVIVTLNLYGDIISDIAAEVAGSVGLAGSANIGNKYAMFEAVHGSAPDIAGKDIANPSGLLNAACMMLRHIGQIKEATIIQNALLRTLEDGIHTADIYDVKISKQKVGTQDFAKAVINNLNNKPKILKAASAGENQEIKNAKLDLPKQERELLGIDIYISYNEEDIKALATKFQKIDNNFELIHIAIQGMKVWPNAEVVSIKSDIARLRYTKIDAHNLITQHDLLKLSKQVIDLGFNIELSVSLYTYEDMAGFTKSQGE